MQRIHFIANKWFSVGFVSLLSLCILLYIYVNTESRLKSYNISDYASLELIEENICDNEKKQTSDAEVLNSSYICEITSKNRCLVLQDKNSDLFWNDKCLPKRCSSDVTVIFLIKSSIYRNSLRRIIRKTWGKEIDLPNLKIRRLFLVGSPPEKKSAPLIDYEIKINRDILQGRFEDTYKSVTLKVILGMKFVKSFCPSVKYVAIADDDVILFPWILFEFLLDKNKFSTSAGVIDKQFYAGHFWHNVTVIHDDREKYNIPRDQYACDTFSSYASGATYIFALSTMIRVHDLSLIFKSFFLDDAYFGALADLLDVSGTAFDENQLSLDCKPCLRPHSSTANECSRLIVCHGLDQSDDHLAVWNEFCFNNVLIRQKMLTKIILFYCSDLVMRI